jgi:hypothetical protein
MVTDRCPDLADWSCSSGSSCIQLGPQTRSCSRLLRVNYFNLAKTIRGSALNSSHLTCAITPLGQLTHSFLSPPAPQLVEVDLAALLPHLKLTHPVQLAYRLWSFIADMPVLRSSADVFETHRPATGKPLITRDSISVGVADPSAALGPVAHPVCELLWPLRRRPVGRSCMVADERSGLAVAVDQQHSVRQFPLVVLHSTEWLESPESCLVELPVHRAREVTAVNLDHSNLGGEHFNAGRFVHDLSLARAVCGAKTAVNGGLKLLIFEPNTSDSYRRSPTHPSGLPLLLNDMFTGGQFLIARSPAPLGFRLRTALYHRIPGSG